MDKIKLLRSLKLGNSIAEYDKNISEYFIDTSYVYDFIEDNYDLVKGVKGSGKTAMLVGICYKQQQYKELLDVKLIQAINIKGDPYFKKAFDELSNELDQNKIIDAWKIYIINIVWNNIIDTLNGYEELEIYLKQNKLITDKPGILSKIVYSLKRVRPKFTSTYNTDGTVTNEFGIGVEKHSIYNEKEDNIIDYNYIFDEIDSILLKNNCRIWVMMDRLDDAFPDNSDESILALKSLLYAYKDICIHDNFKVKIFIRDDIFKNITVKGFTSLTHISSKTMAPIQWDREKIEQLLLERLLFNQEFKQYLLNNNIKIEGKSKYEQLDEYEKNKIFNLLFRKQVDIGEKNPDTMGWIINHIKDGLNIFTPRDFINIIDTARQYQLQELKVNNRILVEDYLIGATALRKAYTKVSVEKLETQLYAEYPQYRNWIEKFKDSKAEHNEETLRKILGKQWKFRVKKLVSIGFVEEKQNTWKVPFIYREALNISQGKAF